MATLTAQILVGKSHPYDGGIIPSHRLYLFENSRPAWMLLPENIWKLSKPKLGKITWIPTVKNMLEDAMLMIALYVIRDEEIVTLAKDYVHSTKQDWVELYQDIDSEHLEKLYEKCRSLSFNKKIIVSVFGGSTVRNQLSILEKYSVEKEICLTQAIQT